MDNFRSFVSVVIAALNEEEGIGPTLMEMQSVLHDSKFIVIDGNSVDKTLEIAKNMGADVLLQEGKGKGNAMSQGLRMYGSKYDFIVFTDADYTYPAEYVPQMIEILEQNPQVGMVIGNRFKSLGVNRSFKNPFYFGNKLLAFAQQVINGVKLADPLSGLRVVRSEALDGLKLKSNGFDIEAELNAIMGRRGYKIVEIPIEYRDRLGEKKLRVRDGWGIMKRIVAEGFAY
ncbi:MAG: glycosyltransferase family 2 protein [Candidatus Bathyarchaeota archaeon]|nr:glycosyltransferase family 2 protein [Candidatus Termiticorpusculum sp.]